MPVRAKQSPRDNHQETEVHPFAKRTNDADLFDRRRVLEQRLEDGYRRIEDARLNRLDIRAWEDFWIQLLREYENVCDELGALAA